MRGRLAFLYGSKVADEVWARLEPRLDAVRKEVGACGAEGLSQRDAILIAYGDSVVAEDVPPLRALTRFVRRHLGDAVSLVHLLPFFPFTSDDGFSISDYERVRPDLGSWEDIEELSRTHDTAFDLVLNHCSASHRWFRDFLEDREPGRDFFVTADPDADVSRVVRPRTHPLLTRFETAAGPRWVWTTFSPDQVDVDFRCPEVLLAYLDLLLLYVRRGARMIRLDAIAFLWKEMGTDCLHLPQTHEVVKLMRDVLEAAAPGVVLLTETNVPHAENVSYFGGGDEAQMVYQFPLPPLLLHALRRGNASALADWLAKLDAPPPGCTFFNFTASHDGVGVRPLEGLVPEEEVWALAEEIRALGGRVGERTRPDGSRAPYELNATYFSALRKPGDDGDRHLERFLLSQTVPMCLQGVPAFYLHSFTATPNDAEGVARTGRNRSIHRKRLREREAEEELADTGSFAARAMETLTSRLRLRARLPEFHPEASQEVLPADVRCLVVRREGLIAAHNVSDEAVDLPLRVETFLLRDAGVETNGDGLRLPPRSVCWFRG